MAESWLDTWQAQSVEELAGRLRSRGAPGPEMWARSELSENIPQTARYLFLRTLWEHLDGAREDMLRELRLGLELDERQSQEAEQVIASSLYILGFNIAYMLDEPDGVQESNGDPVYVARDEPRWKLVELSPDGAATGREVGGLHESLMETVPGGEENAHERGWF